MARSHEQMERHEHKGPRCATATETVCREEQCRHDHHVSAHREVSCTPVHGKADVYDCVHETAGATRA